MRMTASNLQVFFSKTWDQVKFDPDFQREVTWDIPVSEGYKHVTHDASSRSGRRGLSREIQDFKPHALLVYGWNFPGHFHTIRQFHGRVPVWFRGDSHLLDALPLWKKALRRLWLKWVYRHIDFAFTVGSANEAYFDWCGLKPHQMARAPHAVDIAFFKEDHEARLESALQWRAKLGITQTERVVLFAGKLEPKKQPGFLLEVWSKLDAPDCHIIIAGGGPQEPEIHKRWNCHPRVHFIGFQNQTSMPVIYRMADVLCLPSAGPGETWGLTVNEALACGTPCLVSDRAGCAQDIFLQSDYGQSIMWNDKAAWANAILATVKTDKNTVNWSAYLNRFRIEYFVKAISRQFRQLET